MDGEQTIFPEVSYPYGSKDEGVPVLRVLSGGLNGREYPLIKELCVIGRDPDVDIVVDAPEVSRRHATITKMVGQYLLTDTGSRNGVYVHNIRLERSVLKHGDLFQIGPTVFQFIWHNRPVAA